MTIDQAKQRFADTLRQIEQDMGAEIDEVRIKRNTTPTEFNGKPFEKRETRVMIIFG
jgi:hypothetical protein